MKYTFKKEIENSEKGAIIDIPFNVWEICKKEGDVPAKVKIGDTIFVCNLEPKGGGYYNIPIQAEIMSQLEFDKVYPVTFRITKTSVEDSPYSTTNPIRKIDSVEIILQPHDGLCGQTCIAMLAGVSLDDACEIMHCRDWQASMGKMVDTLDYLGLAHSDVIQYTQGAEVELPKCAILMEKMGRYSHYLVYYDGTYYDPTMGILEGFNMSNLVGYLEITTF